jgi:mannosylglycerate hydrolase
MTPTYHIVSHSHWDREWYKTFEQFRSMLVNMVDDLIELLERDPEYRCFTLDGQTVVVDDYLAVRPEREETLRRLVGQGRLVMGPWYVLPDEFLVSGEATVRNLLHGMATARRFGGTMNVGYIPDSFGHIATMPTILAGFGIPTALVYRGFGGEEGQTSSEYRWHAPDGTECLMVHLFRHGYSAGYFHQETDEQILGRFKGLKEDLDARAATSHRLIMNGGDHHWPDPRLPHTMKLLRSNFDGNFVHSTVPAYVDAVRREVGDLPHVHGELRFGYRYAFAVLGGVYSSRMYIKQANWRAQTLLQRYAEPLNALGMIAGMRSQLPLVQHAWRTLMQNHPHDSICGCSVDPVHREMMTRFAAVTDIGNGIVDEGLNALIPYDDHAAGDDRTLFLMNPGVLPRTEIAKAEVRFYLQDIVVGLNPDVQVAPKLPPTKAFGLFDEMGREVPIQVLGRTQGYDITYTRYNYPKQTYAERFAVLVDAQDVPPMGFQGLTIRKKKTFTKFASPLRSGNRFIENAWLRADVQPNGQVVLKDKATGRVINGLHLFEDTGDVGDEYNYSYPKKDRRIVSSGCRARIERIERGPLRVSLRIMLTLMVPAGATPERKARTSRRVPLKIATTISLTKDARSLNFETTVVNDASDHRLRVLLPAGIAAASVLADGQFAVIERKQETYDTRAFTIEHPAAVAPMQRFVAVRDGAHALAVITDGLPEYELLLDGKGTIALTLLRSVGLLAGEDLITRPGGKAGWHSETPDAQCPGTHTFRYAVMPMTRAALDHRAQLEALLETFHVPILAVRRKNEGPLPMSGSYVRLDSGRLTMSAFKQSEDGAACIIRFYNAGPSVCDEKVTFLRPVKQVELARLDETPMRMLQTDADGSVRCTVPSSGIVTLRVMFAGT